MAPLTRHIGLVPTATTTHTEPFHVSLDFVSEGRAGWRAQVSKPLENPHFGRRQVLPLPEPGPDGLPSPDEVAEAEDFVTVVRRLWDSREDDAEIRDADTERFVDRDKLHHVDFVGRWLSVRGPTIVPRPPQGQPLVTALGHAPVLHRFGARSADVVYVTPRDADHARAVVGEIRAAQQAAGRGEKTVQP